MPASGTTRETRLEDVLGVQLALAAQTTSAVFFRVVGGPLDLRPVEYTVLTLIRERPGITQARLARALTMTAPNITAWMTRLAARGLIKRAASSLDRRARMLSVTDEGSRIAVEATERLVEAERGALAHLSSAEYGLLNELLRKVASHR
jgi:DNA-binding MarR family transcriptional regulator